MIFCENKIQRFFVAICIIFFPFIGSIGKAPSFLGGLGKEGSFYPAVVFFSIFFIMTIINKRKIFLPSHKSDIFLIAFIGIAAISLIVNADDLFYAHHQGATGYGRAVIQYGSLCFYGLLSLAFYNFFKLQEDALQFVMKWIIISAAISAGYSIIELGALFSNPLCLSMREFVDSLFRASSNTTIIETYLRGIRSFAAEASFYALYSGIVFPWLFMGVFVYTGKRRYLSAILVATYIILNILSTSRTVYVVFALEAICCFALMRRYISKKNTIAIITLLAVSIGMFYFMFADYTLVKDIDIVSIFQSIFNGDDTHKLSNIARYGSQEAALGMFYTHPLFGIGYGEFGFYAADFYPHEAWQSYEIMQWGSNVFPSVWPPTHNLYTRILGETGILGVLSWMLFILFFLYELYSTAKRTSNRDEKSMMYALIISVLGIVIFSFQNDSMRVIALWMMIGLGWSICYSYK